MGKFLLNPILGNRRLFAGKDMEYGDETRVLVPLELLILEKG